MAMPTWKVTAYPLLGLPVGVTSSDDRLSARMLSAALAIGFWPREA
jgi:hypothetical protein